MTHDCKYYDWDGAMVYDLILFYAGQYQLAKVNDDGNYMKMFIMKYCPFCGAKL